MQDRLLSAIAPYRDRLDAVNRNFSLAGGVRACHKGGWSFVTFNGLEELGDRLEEAISQAKLIGSETTQLADIKPIQDYVAESLLRDPRGVSLAEKRQMVETYNQLLLDFDPRIQTTSSSYRDRFGITYFVNSTGTCIAQERLDVSGGFGAIARGEGGLVRQGYESVHSRSDYDAFTGIENRVR
ncbi:MAG TPA: DNA gyrase modulator, partial [Vampirovibrionales bacterium]